MPIPGSSEVVIPVCKTGAACGVEIGFDLPRPIDVMHRTMVIGTQPF